MKNKDYKLDFTGSLLTLFLVGFPFIIIALGFWGYNGGGWAAVFVVSVIWLVMIVVTLRGAGSKKERKQHRKELDREMKRERMPNLQDIDTDNLPHKIGRNVADDFYNKNKY